MMKIRTNTYELKRLYHGQDKSKNPLNKKEYNSMYNVLVSALKTSALMQSDLDEKLSVRDSWSDNTNTRIINQFLMPKDIVIRLNSPEHTGKQYLTAIRTSLFEPKYISRLVQILGGQKIESSVRIVDPSETLMLYLK